MNTGFDIPVALIIFNRPEETSRVFSVLSQVKPKRLFIIADGPRLGKKDEPLIAQVKEIVSKPSWSCEVVTDYADTNLGCNGRISSGLTRLFIQVDKAIILEDDCVPELSFFTFCRELLLRYENNEEIMTISGNNYVPELSFEADYYFTRYPHCWGWATWARAWKHFDKDMKSWPTFKSRNGLSGILENRSAIRYWSTVFDKTQTGEINSWAYRWVLSSWVRNGLSINPRVNLVSNIGFGENAAHTKTSYKTVTALPTHALPTPLKNPNSFKTSREADLLTERKVYSGGTLKDKIVRKLKGLVGEA